MPAKRPGEVQREVEQPTAADPAWQVTIFGEIQGKAKAGSEAEAHRLAEQDYERRRLADTQRGRQYDRVMVAASLFAYHQSLSNGGAIPAGLDPLVQMPNGQAELWLRRADAVLNYIETSPRDRDQPVRGEERAIW